MSATPRPRLTPIDGLAVSDEQLLEWLDEHNPQLRALDFEADRQEQSIALAQKQYYPDIHEENLSEEKK